MAVQTLGNSTIFETFAECRALTEAIVTAHELNEDVNNQRLQRAVVVAQIARQIVGRHASVVASPNSDPTTITRCYPLYLQHELLDDNPAHDELVYKLPNSTDRFLALPTNAHPKKVKGKVIGIDPQRSSLVLLAGIPAISKRYSWVRPVDDKGQPIITLVTR